MNLRTLKFSILVYTLLFVLLLPVHQVYAKAGQPSPSAQENSVSNEVSAAQSMAGSSNEVFAAQSMAGSCNEAFAEQSMAGSSNEVFAAQSMAGSCNEAFAEQSMEGSSNDAFATQTMAGSSNDIIPLVPMLYKPGSSYSTYDNVSCNLEGNILHLEIPFSVSDSSLEDIKFQITDEAGNLLLDFKGNLSEQQTLTLQFPNNAADASFENAEDLSSFNSAEAYSENALGTSQSENGDSVDAVISKTYTFLITRSSQDLPVLYLTTDSGEPVVDRYEYVPGGVTIANPTGMTATNGSNYMRRHSGTYFQNNLLSQREEAAALALHGTSYSMEIRGRGNASWWKFPQKSYMIKFDESVSLFGMSRSNKYALISTYGDLSLVRNCVAMDMASVMTNLEYTAAQIPVDVFLNGTYLGVYTLSEKVDIASDKINLFSDLTYAQWKFQNVQDIPFLLETGGYVLDSHTSGLDYFYTAHSPQLFVKYPEIQERYDDTITYISDYMNRADQAMTRGYGYEEYIDLDSWVDWFILMEITNNTDSALCRSTFLYKRADSKLMIGPVWDFDMAFGNMCYDNLTYAYWATAEPIYAPAQNHYMSYLYKSDAFMLAVQERWDEIKDELLEAGMHALDKYGAQVAASRPYNNQIRGLNSTDYQVEAIRSFIQRRYDWIDMSIHMADFNRHEPTESVPVFETDEIPLIENVEEGVDAAGAAGATGEAGAAGDAGAGAAGAAGDAGVGEAGEAGDTGANSNAG